MVTKTVTSKIMAGRKKPRHRNPDDFPEWLHAETVDTRLNRQRAYTSGNWAALHDALIQAMTDARGDGRSQKPVDPVGVPLWVLEALLRRVLQPYMVSSKECKSWRKRYRQDLVDWERYCQVLYRKIGGTVARASRWRTSGLDESQFVVMR